MEIELIFSLSFCMGVLGLLDDCTKPFTQDTSTTILSPNSKRVEYSTSILMTKNQNRICLFDEENKTNITLRLIEEYDTCSLNHLYYVPGKVGHQCKSKVAGPWDCNACDSFGKEDGKTMFNDLIIRSSLSSILRCGCRPCECLTSFFKPCVFGCLNIYSEALEGHDSYSVLTCGTPKTVIKLEVVIYKQFQEPSSIGLTLEKEATQYPISTNGVNLTFIVEAVNRKNKEFVNKCFLQHENYELAVVEECNRDVTTSVQGRTGDIRCEEPDMAKYLGNCAFDNSQPLHFDNDKPICNVRLQDNEKDFQNHKLPQRFSDYRIVNSTGTERVKVIFDDTPIRLGFTAEVHYTYFEMPFECNLRAENQTNLAGYIGEAGAAFHIFVRTNRRAEIITSCDPVMHINPFWKNMTTVFEECLIPFNPLVQSLDTSCNISCGKDTIPIRLGGQFKVKHVAVPPVASSEVPLEQVETCSTVFLDFLLRIWGSDWESIAVFVLIVAAFCLCCCSYQCFKDIVLLVFSIMRFCCSFPFHLFHQNSLQKDEKSDFLTTHQKNNIFQSMTEEKSSEHLPPEHLV